jgi:hypothetical protein
MDLALEALATVSGVARWMARHRERGRRWRQVAEACGLSNVREVRTAGFTRRVEADAGPLGLVLTAYPSWNERKQDRGTVVVRGLAAGLAGPSARARAADGAELLEALPPVAGPPLLLCALLDAAARRLVCGLFDGRVDGEGGVVQTWDCSVRLRDGMLTISHSGDLFDDALVGALRAARCLVAPADVARTAAANLRAEADPHWRRHILRTLLAEAPRHAATAQAVRESLTDEADAVRLEAALGSGADGRGALRALTESEDASDAVVAQAVAALDSGLSSADLRGVLRRACARRRTRSAVACVQLLGARGREETDPLVSALSRPDREVVIAAARALTLHADTAAAVVALRDAAAHDPADRELRETVERAVRAVQQRIAGAGAGQLSVADARRGGLVLADDRQGRVSVDPGGEPPQS